MVRLVSLGKMSLWDETVHGCFTAHTDVKVIGFSGTQ